MTKESLEQRIAKIEKTLFEGDIGKQVPPLIFAVKAIMATLEMEATITRDDPPDWQIHGPNVT